ncbi:YoaK family protein [Actinoallomurus soli]|uniref:YoaK family protein n=1 Tax=Actinoallomurus soli TaxID=2952535 RepID=UPI002092D605|nr:YoaK family protein [Actinoallomurus soli]MCO5974392.1 YoaK family protein [Actinoallomurus soli]
MRTATESARRRTVASLELGVLLALVGGFLDAYSFIHLGGVFANAQTGNVVLFGVEAAQGHWGSAVRHLPPIVAFMIGVAVAETLRRPRVAARIRSPARAALVLEILVLVAAGFVSSVVPADALVVVIAFVASVQVSSFRKLLDWPYNTTMTTGNLRSAAQALYVAVADRDAGSARKARSFAVIIVSFLIGGFLGGLLTLRLGAHAIWICAAVLLLALGLFVVDVRRNLLELRRRRSRRPR